MPMRSTFHVFVPRAVVREDGVPIAKLLAERGNRLVDRTRAPVHNEAPHFQAQFIAGDDATGVGAEVVEHLLFARLQHRGAFLFHESEGVCMESVRDHSRDTAQGNAELDRLEMPIPREESCGYELPDAATNRPFAPRISLCWLHFL